MSDSTQPGAAMSDGLGFSSISGTFLEKVARDERLNHDHPRKSRDQRPEKARPNGAGNSEQDADPEESPKPSAHIDLRV